MKILLCHDYYQQLGGEDLSFDAEAELLRANGHDVCLYTVHNDQIDSMSRLDVARRTLWNSHTARELREVIRRERPAVAHCMNSFPLLSPSIYYAARAEGVPMVQSLQNYRLLCPGAYFLRDGKVCEQCLGRPLAWPAIQHGCYRESRAGSAVVASMTALHRLAGTWKNAVSMYLTPTRFARAKFIEAGFDPDRIAVKPNFVEPDPGPGDGGGGYAIFVGRLSPEKGITTLLEAWSDPRLEMPLKIVGTGPMAREVTNAARDNPRLDFVGLKPLVEVLDLVGRATCLVMPSVWYETFGRTIVEAFAKGTPVVASNMGCMAELICNEATGLLFEPGSAAGLTDALFNLASDTQRLSRMRTACRREYEAHYRAGRNYELLMEIYERAGAGRAVDADSPVHASHGEQP